MALSRIEPDPARMPASNSLEAAIAAVGVGTPSSRQVPRSEGASLHGASLHGVSAPQLIWRLADAFARTEWGSQRTAPLEGIPESDCHGWPGTQGIRGVAAAAERHPPQMRRRTCEHGGVRGLPGNHDPSWIAARYLE